MTPTSTTAGSGICGGRRAELLEAAVDVDAMAGSAAPHAEDPDAVAQAVTDLLLRWLRRPEIVRTQAELALEAARRPELMDVFGPRSSAPPCPSWSAACT